MLIFDWLYTCYLELIFSIKRVGLRSEPNFGDTVITYFFKKEFKVTPTVPRILFAIASSIFAISFVKYNIYIFRFKDGNHNDYLDYLGPVVSMTLQIIFFALAAIFAGKRVVTVVSVLAVYFIELLLRFPIYLLREGYNPELREVIQYWVLPIFMIPSYIPELSFESLVFYTSDYFVSIGFYVAIIGVVLTFVGVRQENPRSASVATADEFKPMFVDARDSGKHSIEINTSDGIDQVDRLGDLLKKGLITQEEFDFKKRQILGL